MDNKYWRRKYQVCYHYTFDETVSRDESNAIVGMNGVDATINAGVDTDIKSIMFASMAYLVV